MLHALPNVTTNSAKALKVKLLTLCNFFKIRSLFQDKRPHFSHYAAYIHEFPCSLLSEFQLVKKNFRPLQKPWKGYV